MRFRLPAVVAALLVAAAAASNVVELTSDDFHDVIGKGKPALVEFYAPWCGHCKNLAPVYEQLADGFAHAKNKVIIAKIDADGTGKDIGQKQGVTGFPTLKWFDADESETSSLYDGSRDLDALAKFVTEKSGVKSKIKPPAPPATLQLDFRNFDDYIYNESKDVLLAFTAPWCGHCKNMKPHLEKVAVNFANERNCVIANIDADAAQNKDIAKEFNVTGYPTIKFFPKAKKSYPPIDYDGPRTVEGFTEFLNQHCGTHRLVAGGLAGTAGRHAQLDELAQKYINAPRSERPEIMGEARSVAFMAGIIGKPYTKIFEKLSSEADDSYIAKELTRLKNILKKKALTDTKLDEIQKRANVLEAFVKTQVDSAKEAVKDAAGTVKETVEDAAEAAKEKLADVVEDAEDAAASVKEKAEEVVQKAKDEL